MGYEYISYARCLSTHRGTREHPYNVRRSWCGEKRQRLFADGGSLFGDTGFGGEEKV